MAGQYTSVDKVKSMFRSIKIEPATGIENDDTVLTTEEVDEFIGQVEAIMNAKLSTCYANATSISAVSNPEGHKMLAFIARLKVAAIVKNILSLTGKNSKGVQQDLRDDFSSKAKALMEKICPDNSGCDPCKNKPEIPLPDVPLISEPPTAAKSIISSSHKAVFKKDSPNW